MRFAVDRGAVASDNEDVRIRFSLSNVMRTSDLSEYTGELRASTQVRLTDRDALVQQTTQHFPLEFDVPCVPTEPTVDKSLCELTTTLETLIPGALVEFRRDLGPGPGEGLRRRAGRGRGHNRRQLAVRGAGRVRSLGVGAACRDGGKRLVSPQAI